MATHTRTQSLLTSLQRVEEDMLALGDDILLSIRPTDKESVEIGCASLRSYTDCLAGFRAWYQRYRDLVSSKEITDLARQAPEATAQAPATGIATSERGHQLGEDFRYTKPARIRIEGLIDSPVETWRQMLVACSTAFIQRFPDFLQRIHSNEQLHERGSKPLYALDASLLRDPIPVPSSEIYVEGNLSANGIKDVIGHLLTQFTIPKTHVRIFLQSPANAS